MIDTVSNMLANTTDALAKDMVNHPPHYKSHKMECIDEMILAFGEKAVFHYCIINAWKYRYRAGSKGAAEEDLKKSDWYMAKADEIKRYRQYPQELYSDMEAE